MSADLPLDRVQRWFQAVMTSPLGVEAGLRSEAAPASPGRASPGDSTPADGPAVVDAPLDIDSVLTRSQRLSATERLRVYANAYVARLLECLQADYPVVRHTVGDDAFTQFALEYLHQHPPASHTLAELGSRFPRFLEETRPPEERDGAGFAAFLIDLARLERIYAEVFDGDGPEGKPALSQDALRTVPAERWSDARLVPAAGLRLESFRFPAHTYASAARRFEDPPIPAAATTRLAIFRRDFIVRRQALSETQHQLLAALIKGSPLGAAIEAATASAPEHHAPQPESLRAWFAEWTRLGFFRAIELG